MKKTTFCNCLGILVVLLITLSACTNARNEILITPGAYRLGQYIGLLDGKKVGIVANQTSLIGPEHIFDTLRSLGIQVATIFTPEHGLMGKNDAGLFVDDEKHGTDSVPVISLYGKKKKPDSSDMKGIEIMVFDLQDVGVRFYTYISTLHYIMETCAKENVPLIVLDRPNPNGFYIDGPVLDKQYASFVGMHPVPVVYGLTIGEYALMINGEHWLKDSVQCKLTIIPCSGYDHNSRYELPIYPSPNLPTMQSVYLYPSLAFFEGTVVSINKGTDYPFLMIGHPHYPDHRFSFIPVSKPGSGMHPLFEGKICYGLDLRTQRLDSLSQLKSIDLKYLIHFYNSLNEGGDFFNDFFDKLAGSAQLRRQIIEGKPEVEIKSGWQPGIESFKKIRAKYLLYPDFTE